MRLIFESVEQYWYEFYTNRIQVKLESENMISVKYSCQLFSFRGITDTFCSLLFRDQLTTPWVSIAVHRKEWTGKKFYQIERAPRCHEVSPRDQIFEVLPRKSLFLLVSRSAQITFLISRIVRVYALAQRSRLSKTVVIGFELDEYSVETLLSGDTGH